ncbi:SHQ1 protein-domain-containing protein [Lipomyces kononenkoae]|uniref:SHQ1 protein-domain-containing protein n=1 Tax=Lipomyces kononenkoae TaxID=34357 RepID=A0ACC3T9P3_LIPKO
MITPHFSVRQDPDFVYIDIKVVHIKAQNVELRADGDIFLFSLPPYYLRLHFPGNIVDDERASASFDLETQTLAVKFPKEKPGEEFHDLDLVTKLLARVGEQSQKDEASGASGPESNTKPLIEELSSDDHPDNKQEDDGFTNVPARFLSELDDAENFDWQITQEYPSAEEESLLSASYGFNLQYSSFLRQTADTGNDINDLDNPESSTIESRSKERIEKEDNKFDPDYYLSDLFANDDIRELIQFMPPIVQTIQRSLQGRAADEMAEMEFTEVEKKRMMNLPRRTYIIDSMISRKSLYLGLIPLLFGYSYDVRTTLDDHTSESAWTIGKLAANISCLDSSFTSVTQVMIACTRRSLAYPLYRNWDLSLKCWDDVYYLLRGGKRAILKVLLDVNQVFAFHDTYYVYAKIVTEDYCAWVQTASDSVIRSLAHEIRHTKIAKDDLGWSLTEIENVAATR